MIHKLMSTLNNFSLECLGLRDVAYVCFCREQFMFLSSQNKSSLAGDAIKRKRWTLRIIDVFKSMHVLKCHWSKKKPTREIRRF